jgi:signal transduction histidine kinase
MLAFLLPFVVAVITNIILPGVLKHPVLPLATLFGAASAIMVLRGIFLYRLFEVDPQIIAQNILDTMSEGVIIVKHDRTIESLNNEASRLLGVKLVGNENISLEPFFTPSDWSLIAPKLDPTSDSVKDQLINKSSVKTKDNVTTPVRIAITSLEDEGQKLASILVLTDITQIVASYDALQQSAKHIYEQNEQLTKLEQQLREEKAGVEHTVEVRTKELVEAQERLKASDQLKTEFIMLTSHNLRTPLAIAQGYADIAYEGEQDEKKKQYIEGLKDGLKRLAELVESLITINYIEAGNEIKLAEVPFSQIIDPLIKETQDLAATKNDKFVVNLNAGDVKVKADVARLQGALRSLLNNACKFTQDGEVALNTTLADKRLIIGISDTGIGIDPKELDRLFTKFHKGTDIEVNDYDGQGIGLYLAKLIIDEHQGKITAVSELGKGSTFTIELPCY